MIPIELKYISPENKYRYLSPLMKNKWAMLLDSGSKLANFSTYRQFDIFCFEPTVCLQYQHNNLQYTENSVTITKNTTAPFNTMRQLLQKYSSAPDNLEQSQQTTFNSKNKRSIPFNGGWLGYISYDYGRNNLIPSKHQTQDNIPLIKMGLFQWAMISDHKNKSTTLYNFGLNEILWESLIRQFRQIFNQVELDNIYSESVKNVTNNLDEQDNHFKITSAFHCNTSKKQYAESFNAIKNYIHEGDCYQVNLAQKFEASVSGCPFAIYHYLAQQNNTPFSAYLNFPDFQILSLSPERFIESNNRLVKTQPIKGTLPRNDDPLKDQALAKQLTNSTKDKAENLMIVDLMRNDLSKTAEKNSVHVSELFTHYRFESVHHLISTIESKLSAQCDNFDLLDSCLPGGSITGAPKKRAMEIIDELEESSREIYCGIIAYIDFSGKMDSNICIRTLLHKSSKLSCWAGGGLVDDSTLKNEYQEIFDKISKIVPPLDKLVTDVNIMEPR